MGTWHCALGCRTGFLSLSPTSLLPLPRSAQKHLSLMKCFPLCGHLAHAATRQLLSDKEEVGGRASQQVGLTVLQSGPASEPQSYASPASSLDSWRKAEGPPFRVGIPAPCLLIFLGTQLTLDPWFVLPGTLGP